MDPKRQPLDPRDTIVRQSFRRVSHYDRSLPADLASLVCDNPASLVRLGEPLQTGAARRTVRLEWNSQPFVLKHYAEHTRRHTIKQLVLPSRAKRTWDFAHRLVAAGIATPRPVACVENRLGPLRRDSFLMYPFIDGRTLQNCIAEDAKRSPAIREQLWQQIHDVWQRLVDLRISLGDTNLANFIVCPTGELWLIDLDKSRVHRRRSAAAPHQQRAWEKLVRGAEYYD